MVERGARHLLLLGRTPVPDRESWGDLEAGSRGGEQVAAIRGLESQGVRVYTAAADVARSEELDAALEAFRQAGAPTVRGVIHTAGIAQGSTVANLSAESLSEVLRPKVQGTWLLHERFSGEEVELFVLFSAIPALVGWIGAGASNYSAANAFLDTFAHFRRGLGLPALGISWGPWSRIGVAAREPGGLEQLGLVGIGSYSPETALGLFDRMLGHGGVQVGVASLDWAKFFRAFPAATRSPQMAFLAEEAGSQAGGDSELRAALVEASAEERPDLLEGYFRRQVAHALAIPAGRLEVDRSLLELGLDSLMAIDLRNRLESELEVSIPMVTLLQGPSVQQLVGEVLPYLPPPMDELAPLEEGMEEITL
jgi:acyl carrier protein